MKRLLFLIFCLLPLQPGAVLADERQVAELGAEFWFTPRHGDAIAAHAGLGAAVRGLLAEPEAYLVLRHPEGETGELWGQELQGWLVALGVVSDRIERQAGPAQLESVAVLLVSPASEQPAVEDVPADAPVLETETSLPTEVQEDIEIQAPAGESDGEAQQEGMQVETE